MTATQMARENKRAARDNRKMLKQINEKIRQRIFECIKYLALHGMYGSTIAGFLNIEKWVVYKALGVMLDGGLRNYRRGKGKEAKDVLAVGGRIRRGD